MNYIYEDFNGVSARPPNGFVPKYVSESPDLINKISHFVIQGKINQFTLRVYRKSSKRPGMYSCDEYQIINFKRIGKPKKDKQKYEYKPIPEGAMKTIIVEEEFYSFNELTSETKRRLKKLLEKNFY